MLIASADIEKGLDYYNATLRLVADVNDSEQLDKLRKLPQKLAEYGLNFYVDKEEGHDVIRVIELKNPAELLNALRKSGAVSSQRPQITEHKKIHPDTASGVWNFVKRNALRFRSIASFFGDFSILMRNRREKYLVEHSKDFMKSLSSKDAAAVKQGAQHNFGVMAAYSTQGIINLIYNGGSSEIEFTELMSRIEKKIYQNGGKISSISQVVLNSAQEQKGKLQKLYRAFRKNTPMVSETIPIYADIKKIRTGVGKVTDKEGGKEKLRIVDGGQFYTGVSHLIGDVIAAWIPEQSRESIDSDSNAKWYQKNGIYKWIAERPFRIQSWLALSNKPAQFYSAWKVMKDPVERKWGCAEAASYTLSRFLGSFASKKSGKPGDVSAYDPAVAIAANWLVGLPDDRIKDTVAVISGELSQEIQKSIGEKVDADTVSQSIMKKLDELKTSLFVTADNNAAVGEADEKTDSHELVTAVDSSPEKGAWQKSLTKTNRGAPELAAATP